MNALRRALALANMVSMGLEEDALPRTLRLWSRYQRILKTIATSHRIDQFAFDVPKLDVDPSRHMFLSAHFGIYAHALATVAFRSPRKRLAVLIGEQGASQAALLQAIGRRHGCEIEFIHGGFSLIKGARRAIASDIPLFMLIDVPWGVSTPADGRTPFLQGVLHTRSAYFKLCDALALRPSFLLSKSDTSLTHHEVELLGETSHDKAGSDLCAAIEARPFLWDRWFDCQKFTEPGRRIEGAVPFRALREPHALSLPSFRAFRLTEQLYSGLRGELRQEGAGLARFNGPRSGIARQLSAMVKSGDLREPHQ